MKWQQIKSITTVGNTIAQQYHISHNTELCQNVRFFDSLLERNWVEPDNLNNQLLTALVGISVEDPDIPKSPPRDLLSSCLPRRLAQQLRVYTLSPQHQEYLYTAAMNPPL